MAQRRDRFTQARESAAVSQHHIKRKEQMRRQLQSYYGRYGDQVLNTITLFYNLDGSLRKLIHRLTGRVVTDWNRQHEILSDYLNRNGEAVFLREVQKIKKKEGMITETSEETPPPDEASSEEIPPGEETPMPSEPSSKKKPRVRLPNGEVIPDRRQGERRSGKDRRENIEAIRKNKRFGGDRRRHQRRRRPPDFVEGPED